MKKTSIILIAVLGLTGCLTKPVADQVTSDQLEERVQVLELKVIETTDKLTDRIQALEEKLSEKEQETKMGNEISNSSPIEEIEQSKGETLNPINEPVIRNVEPAAPLYKKAFQAYKSRQYSNALEHFLQFILEYPDHKLAANAHYWLGETYYDQKLIDQSIKAFERVVRSFPESPKAPDALLKLGLMSQRTGDSAKSATYFQQLSEQYPHSRAAARVASLRKSP